MSTAFEIPLIPQSQTFRIALAGVTYRLNIYWSTASNSWILDIFNNNEILLIGGIPMITGTDLLAPYAYMNFGGKLTCVTDNNFDAVATYQNLGGDSHLYFVTPT